MWNYSCIVRRNDSDHDEIAHIDPCARRQDLTDAQIDALEASGLWTVEVRCATTMADLPQPAAFEARYGVRCPPYERGVL